MLKIISRFHHKPTHCDQHATNNCILNEGLIKPVVTITFNLIK